MTTERKALTREERDFWRKQASENFWGWGLAKARCYRLLDDLDAKDAEIQAIVSVLVHAGVASPTECFMAGRIHEYVATLVRERDEARAALESCNRARRAAEADFDIAQRYIAKLEAVVEAAKTLAETPVRHPALGIEAWYEISVTDMAALKLALSALGEGE